MNAKTGIYDNRYLFRFMFEELLAPVTGVKSSTNTHKAERDLLIRISAV